MFAELPLAVPFDSFRLPLLSATVLAQFCTSLTLKHRSLAVVPLLSLRISGTAALHSHTIPERGQIISSCDRALRYSLSDTHSQGAHRKEIELAFDSRPVVSLAEREPLAL